MRAEVTHLRGLEGGLLVRVDPSSRLTVATMVATLRLRQLQDDVRDSEQAELRRLEGGVTDGDESDEGQLVTAGSDTM